MTHLFKVDIKMEKSHDKKETLKWFLKQIDDKSDTIRFSTRHGNILIAPYNYKHTCDKYCHIHCNGYDCNCLMCIDVKKMCIPSDYFIGILRVLKTIGVYVEKINYDTAEDFSNWYKDESWTLYIKRYEVSQITLNVPDVSKTVLVDEKSLYRYVKNNWFDILEFICHPDRMLHPDIYECKEEYQKSLLKLTQ